MILFLTAYLLVGEGLLFHFRDRPPPFGVLLGRLLSAIYFGVGLHQFRVPRPRWRIQRSTSRQPPMRRYRVQSLCGPSRRLVFGVIVVWLVALALLARMVAVTLRELSVC